MAISIRDARGVQPLVAASGTPVVVPDEANKPADVDTVGDVSDADARDAAANLLLRDVDQVVADFCREVAYLHSRIPLWAVIVGAVQRCYEDSTLIAPVLPPMVRRLTDGFVPPGTRGDSTCEVCQVRFSAKRLRQRTCGAEACGLAIQQKDIAADLLKQNRNLTAYDAIHDVVVRGSSTESPLTPDERRSA